MKDAQDKLYYTVMTKLRSAGGSSHTCMALDAAVKEYARDYLLSNKYLSAV